MRTKISIEIFQKSPGTIVPGLLNVRERIRTPDTLVRSQVLYPAELRTRTHMTAAGLIISATVIILPHFFSFVNSF